MQSRVERLLNTGCSSPQTSCQCTAITVVFLALITTITYSVLAADSSMMGLNFATANIIGYVLKAADITKSVLQVVGHSQGSPGH